MRIVLDLALSADGFIARSNGDSSWVSEKTEELFKQRVKEAGCLVVGNTTFEQFRNIIYPIQGVLNIVLSKEDRAVNESDVIYASTPEEAIYIAAENNCPEVLIAGGASVAKAFLEANLIDEIYFSIHAIELGQGIRPFGDIAIPKTLVLLDSVDLGEDIRQDHYKVEK